MPFLNNSYRILFRFREITERKTEWWRRSNIFGLSRISSSRYSPLYITLHAINDFREHLDVTKSSFSIKKKLKTFSCKHTSPKIHLTTKKYLYIYFKQKCQHSSLKTYCKQPRSAEKRLIFRAPRLSKDHGQWSSRKKRKKDHILRKVGSRLVFVINVYICLSQIGSNVG